MMMMRMGTDELIAMNLLSSPITIHIEVFCVMFGFSRSLAVLRLIGVIGLAISTGCGGSAMSGLSKVPVTARSSAPATAVQLTITIPATTTASAERHARRRGERTMKARRVYA